MDNPTLARLYKNTKFCPVCKRIETGIVRENGLISLPCGTNVSADKKWHSKGDMQVAYGK